MDWSSHADAEADFQLALKLSRELNDDDPTLPGSPQDYDHEADFALAVSLQYQDETQQGANEFPSLPKQGPTVNKSATPVTDTWGLSKDDAEVAEYQGETATGKASFRTFTEFSTCVKNFRCTRCHERYFESALDAEQLFQQWLKEKTVLSSLVTCKRCRTSSCIACTPEPFTKPSRLVHQGKQMSWCCAGGRLFLLWILLCGFDRQYNAARAKPAAPSKSSQPKSSKGTSSKRNRGGTGYGSGRESQSSSMPGGMGFGGAVHEGYDFMDDVDALEEFKYLSGLSDFQGKGYTFPVPRNAPATKRIYGKTAAQDAQETQDIFGALIFGFLQGLLPSLDRNTGFDIDPPEAATDMLVNSKILTYCAELLRTDSLEDATRRKNTYSALLNFLQATGRHLLAMRTLFGERPRWPDTTSLVTLTFAKCSEPPKEMAASLADCLRNLTTQSVMFLQTAKSNEKDFRTNDGQDMLWLCRQISDLSRYINAYVRTTPPEDVRTSVEAIKEVSDGYVLNAHAHASTAKALKSSPPGRFKRLVTEIATLKTGLPPGIFVRYCESRLDVLKCVIVGPLGTPYENGLFEFDFYCDGSFPNKPPKVTFKGTAGGRVSINPNLYANGKVCLSLLGTWAGEPWDPARSTLLQVLVSLQAMILCEEPWYNEPGRESSYGRTGGHNPAAKAYNHRIREQTVRHAMLTWLDKIPELWTDVVEQHFKRNADKILQTATVWAKAKVNTQHQPGRYGYDDYNDYNDYDDYIASGLIEPPIPGQPVVDKGDLASLLPQLSTALKRYGASFVVPNIPNSVIKQRPSTTQYPPPLPSFMEPYHSMTHNQGNSLGHFWPSGHVLGGNPAGQSPAPTASSKLGGSITGGVSERSHRYETRSSTEDSGAFNFNTPPTPYYGQARLPAPPSLFFGGGAFTVTRAGPPAPPSLSGGGAFSGTGPPPSMSVPGTFTRTGVPPSLLRRGDSSGTGARTSTFTGNILGRGTPPSLPGGNASMGRGAPSGRSGGSGGHETGRGRGSRGARSRRT